MVRRMDTSKVRSLSGGARQQGMRNHNERLLLSMIQRYGEMPSSELARLSGLSAQTVSVIMRKLIDEGLLKKGKPQKGKVGKPSTPLTLAHNGVYSFGLNIGRRSAEILLMDFRGTVQNRLHHSYPYPLPETVFAFLKSGIDILLQDLRPREISRISGIGIAAPHEFWNWNEYVGAPKEEFKQWLDIDFPTEIAKFSMLPVYRINDATAACRAEHVFGRGKEFRDYAYFFVGAFVGGGIVLNHSVFEGNQKNAGAFASIPSSGGSQTATNLLDLASIYVLETALVDKGINPEILWVRPQNWESFPTLLENWIDQSARELARAIISVCAVIDFEAILIDGAFPSDVRQKLVARTRAHFQNLDTRGIISPEIKQGSIGEDAPAIGAACGPVISQFFINTNAGLPAL